MKKVNSIITVIAMSIVLLFSVNVKADSKKASFYVDQATSQKSFYYYNLAYEEILKLDVKEQDELLNKLGNAAKDIWTEDIKKINSTMQELAKTGSGKTYNELEALIRGANIAEIDQVYFLSELTSWGKKIVYTEDYVKALNLLSGLYESKKSNHWSSQFQIAIDSTKERISEVKNDYSRAYLWEEYNIFKQSIGMEIDENVPAWTGKDKEEIVTISKDSEKQSNIINISVKGNKDSKVNIVVRFKAGAKLFSGAIDDTGVAIIPVDITGTETGKELRIDVTIIEKGKYTSESTSYTP